MPVARSMAAARGASRDAGRASPASCCRAARDPGCGYGDVEPPAARAPGAAAQGAAGNTPLQNRWRELAGAWRSRRATPSDASSSRLSLEQQQCGHLSALLSRPCRSAASAAGAPRRPSSPGWMIEQRGERAFGRAAEERPQDVLQLGAPRRFGATPSASSRSAGRPARCAGGPWRRGCAASCAPRRRSGARCIASRTSAAVAWPRA